MGSLGPSLCGVPGRGLDLELWGGGGLGEQVQGRRLSIWLSTDKIRNQGGFMGHYSLASLHSVSGRLESEFPRQQTKGIIKQWPELVCHFVSLV